MKSPINVFFPNKVSPPTSFKLSFISKPAAAAAGSIIQPIAEISITAPTKPDNILAIITFSLKNICQFVNNTLLIGPVTQDKI